MTATRTTMVTAACTLTAPQVLGTYRYTRLGVASEDEVTFDGKTVRCGHFETKLDCDLSEAFRAWLSKRGVVLP